jgi:hypothetical protein
MFQAIPDVRGFLDYGATAALAAYMVWLWNKHTLRWQDKQVEIDAIHRAALERLAETHDLVLTKLVDRYDQHLEKLITVLERNTEVKARMMDAVTTLNVLHKRE